MATSNIRIKKKCEWCGSEFDAQKYSTKFCSKRCAEHAYKERKRQELKHATEAQVTEMIQQKRQDELKSREFLSVQEVANLIGTNRDAVYKLIYR